MSEEEREITKVYLVYIGLFLLGFVFWVGNMDLTHIDHLVSLEQLSPRFVGYILVEKSFKVAVDILLSHSTIRRSRKVIRQLQE